MTDFKSTKIKKNKIGTFSRVTADAKVLYWINDFWYCFAASCQTYRLHIKLNLTAFTCHVLHSHQQQKGGVCLLVANKLLLSLESVQIDAS